MIRLRVDRIRQEGRATLSMIYVDGTFVCFGLEDEFRTVKERGNTRIPAGVYRLTRRFEGRHFVKYSKAYGHRSTLWVRDVPGFEYIMIHVGNDHLDTLGCLLCGSTASVDAKGHATVSGSVIAYRKLYSIVSGRIDAEGATIEYRDLDRCASKCAA